MTDATSAERVAADRAELKRLVDSHKRVVFFGGAGVSTASGIPDFRSAKGVFNQDYPYPYPPEVMVSRSFFDEHTEEFYDFYRTKMIFTEAQPNACHRKLAELEAEGKVSAVITQNIDGLHQKAGSKRVLELHGGIERNYCMDCGAAYGLGAITESEGVPRCSCGGIIKPDVVLYEEPLNESIIEQAVDEIAQCDMLIVAGTSLVVYPAAGFVRYFRGDCLALVNKSATTLDSQAQFLSHESVAEVMDW